MIMGAGWPFFMGGITKYLDQKGYSKKVTGKLLANRRIGRPSIAIKRGA